MTTVEELTRQLAQERERADYAWRNTRAIDKHRMEKEAELADFVAALKETERQACAVIAAVGADAPIAVPERDYESMTPKDCYEAGLMDGGVAVRKAIRAAIDAALMPNEKVRGPEAALSPEAPSRLPG